jgi:DNA-binding transcriptional LysR family regulator
MELRHLRYFVAVAGDQNVTRAAERLHVSQPGLSRQIRDLEDELGFALFERTAKSIRLTEAGQVFLTEARAVLQRAEEGVRAARAVAEGRIGEINVGYAPSLTTQILPQALRAFQAESPGVRVLLHDLTTEEMLGRIRDGKIDVSLGVRPSRAQMKGLTFQKLVEYPICVAVAPGHPLARRRSVPRAHLGAGPLIASREAPPASLREALRAGAKPRRESHHGGH